MQNSIRMLQDSNNSDTVTEFRPAKKQQSLADFSDEDSIQVIVDQREIRSTVARNLEKLGADLTLKNSGGW